MSIDLLKLARRLGTTIDASSADMVLVSGSAARGLSDPSSDIDLYIYRSDKIPTTPSLPPPESVLVFSVPTANGRFEKFRSHGRFVDVVQLHTQTLSAVANRIGDASIGADDVKVAAGLRDAVALSGSEMLESWQRRMVMNDAVAVCEVERLGALLLSPQVVYALTVERSDWLSFSARLSSVMLSGIGLLGAVNRRWVPLQDPKWMPWHVDQFHATPSDVLQRIEAALRAPDNETIDDPGLLLTEILDLVDRAIDGADTRTARFALQLVV